LPLLENHENQPDRKKNSKSKRTAPSTQPPSTPPINDAYKEKGAIKGTVA
jgi:hypothetical protein